MLTWFIVMVALFGAALVLMGIAGRYSRPDRG
jgi:hypothetical protein